MNKYNDIVCLASRWGNDNNTIYFNEIQHVHISELYKCINMMEYGDYLIKFKYTSDNYSCANIGRLGTYIVIDNVKYEVNENTIGKITTVLYNREMNEAIDNL